MGFNAWNRSPGPEDTIAASLLAASGAQLVLDQAAAPPPELDLLLDGQRWAFEEPAFA